MPERIFGDELTEKECALIIAYLINGGEKANAARMAGYKGNNSNLWLAADRCLKRPLVKKTMQEMMEAAEKKLGINLEWKMKKLKRAINAGIRDKGEDDAELENAQIGLQAIDMLNKMQGHYSAEKKESKHSFEDFEAFQQLIKHYERDH